MGLLPEIQPSSLYGMELWRSTGPKLEEKPMVKKRCDLQGLVCQMSSGVAFFWMTDTKEACGENVMLRQT